MSIPSRSGLMRIWYSGLVGLLLTPFTLVASGSAQTGVTLPEARPQSSGWYIDRDPDYTDQIFGPSAPSDGARAAYAEDHLFVGWDGADKTKPEYISALSFDLFQLGIPEKSTINSFVVTLIEHETSNPSARTHNTPNTTNAIAQGIIMCAAPTFISGQPGEALARAPERDCSASVLGTRGGDALDPDVPASQGHTYAWTFDVTAMVSQMIADEGSIGFTMEPRANDQQHETWLLSFHNVEYKETDATGVSVPKPGVSAAITYTPPAESTTSGGSGGGFEEFTEFTESPEAPSFSDSEGLVEELAPEPEAPAEPEPRTQTRALGATQEGRVPFWDIPPFAWALILFSMLTLGASGWLLQLNPAAPRPPGAASALMNGHGPRKEP